MKNPITESFWGLIISAVRNCFDTLQHLYIKDYVSIVRLEQNLMISFEHAVDKALPAIQVQAVESLFALDMLNEYEQWDVIGELFENEKNFEHLTSAFAEYKSALLLYGQELLPHQKTMLIKKAIELYPEIDRISFNV
jgi:hypothetical protein